MGLLDQVIGGVLGQVLGGGRHGQGGESNGGTGSLSPIVQALLMLLMSKGAGGLGDLLGGGARPHDDDSHIGHGSGGRDPGGYGGDGDLGGFGQDRAGGYDREGNSAPRDRQDGDFGDLAGMLDGPGDRDGGPQGGGSTGRDPGAGPYAHLDGEAGDGETGLDGLIDRFQRGGLGETIESWIGHGDNRPVQPRQLADALGSDTVDALQQRTGLQRDDLLSQLAQALPQVIDRLTPQGRRPTGEDTRSW